MLKSNALRIINNLRTNKASSVAYFDKLEILILVSEASGLKNVNIDKDLNHNELADIIQLLVFENALDLYE